MLYIIIFKNTGECGGMKKKWIFFAVAMVLILFLAITKLMKPEKTLVVGSQVDDSSYDFTEEIKDKEKIVEFEKWFNNIDFSSEIKEPNGYAEIIIIIRDYEQGTYTHPVSLWIDEDNFIVTNKIGFENTGGKISKTQLDELQKIIK